MNTSINFLQQYPFILAFIIGLVPALVWLWFWLKEDRHHEPAKMITLSFLGGMLAVLCVLPFQKIVYFYFSNEQGLSFTLFATIEEVFKFMMAYFVALRNKVVTDEPVDDTIYLIISALGFVTFENTLFLITPIKNGDIIGVLTSGNLRFIGASLLHIIASATIGISMGLAFYKTALKKRLHILSGLVIAIVLHTAFNLFIINGTEGNIFLIFGVVWIGVVGLLLLFERVKHVEPLKLEN